MAQQAVGMIECRGLCALLEACDAALKAANVTLVGWEKIGSGYVTGFFRGGVAAGKAATLCSGPLCATWAGRRSAVATFRASSGGPLPRSKRPPTAGPPRQRPHGRSP